MLKPRSGISLVEVLVALVLTAVIGAALTGAFASQLQFFDAQERAGFARGVSRGAMNIIMSELRMLEQGGGLAAATNRRVTIRAPYAMGIVCHSLAGVVTISRLPSDSVTFHNAAPTGWAFRNASTGSYTYVEGAPSIVPNSGAALCAAASIAVITEGTGNGGAMQITGSAVNPAVGTPILLYQQITYEFKSSISFPGRLALFRSIDAPGSELDEEIVAPFDTTAKFRFFVSDAAEAQTAVPAALNTVTGIELTLDGLSERPDRYGNPQSLPLTTSVYFKNRL